MITLEEAKLLKPREVLVDPQGRRWYVNGKVKLWKTDKRRIYVPLKHGLYRHSFIDTTDFNEYGENFHLTRERY